jgi:phosphoglycerate dehydrogenase-like enzyme
MKLGSILINTSRARIVDEKALIKVLRDGPLVAAALDAWDENGPNIAEFASLDNLILSQHIGASTTESIIRTGIMAVEEVYRGLNNEQLLNKF